MKTSAHPLRRSTVRGSLRLPSSGGGLSGGLESSAGLGSQGCRAAQHEALWANCLSCRTGVRCVDDPRTGGAGPGGAGRPFYAANLARALRQFAPGGVGAHVFCPTSIPFLVRGGAAPCLVFVLCWSRCSCPS